MNKKAQAEILLLIAVIVLVILFSQFGGCSLLQDKTIDDMDNPDNVRITEFSSGGIKEVKPGQTIDFLTVIEGNVENPLKVLYIDFNFSIDQDLIQRYSVDGTVFDDFEHTMVIKYQVPYSASLGKDLIASVVLYEYNLTGQKQVIDMRTKSFTVFEEGVNCVSGITVDCGNGIFNGLCVGVYKDGQYASLTEEYCSDLYCPFDSPYIFLINMPSGVPNCKCNDDPYTSSIWGYPNACEN